jgi:hypothetical protein
LTCKAILIKKIEGRPIDIHKRYAYYSGVQAKELIEKLDGVTAVAGIFSIKPPSVSEWYAKNDIPEGRLIILAVVAEQRGIATRQQIFPTKYTQIWPELAERKVA